MSKLPEVFIDARMVGPVPHGIARYVTRLASGLHRLSLEGTLPYRPIFLVRKDFSGQDFERCEIRRVRAKFLSPVELVELPLVLRGAKLYHSPSFCSLFPAGPFRPRCPWIVTIHDLNHLTYGSRFQKEYYCRLLRPFAEKAAAVATVSEFSRQEIASWLGQAPARIDVVYNALDASDVQTPSDEKCRETLSHFGLESGKYLLCLSNPKPHKNIPFLVEAYRESRIDWPLVLSMKEFSDIPGVRAVGGLSDADVRVLRARAGAMVFPSLYEGFGLPPIEAVSAGVPLIASRIPPHQEGLADLAPDEVCWIDPRDRRSLADALVSAREGRVPRASEGARRKILERFSEMEMARHMDQIYRRVLNMSA